MEERLLYYGFIAMCGIFISYLVEIFFFIFSYRHNTRQNIVQGNLLLILKSIQTVVVIYIIIILYKYHTVLRERKTDEAKIKFRRNQEDTTGTIEDIGEGEGWGEDENEQRQRPLANESPPAYSTVFFSF